MVDAATLGDAVGCFGSGPRQVRRPAPGCAVELQVRLAAPVAPRSLRPPVLGAGSGPGEYPRWLCGCCCVGAVTSLLLHPAHAVLLWLAGSALPPWLVPHPVLAGLLLAALAGRGSRVDPGGRVEVVAATAFASGSRGPAGGAVGLVVVLLVPPVAVDWHFLLCWTSLLLLLVPLLRVLGAVVDAEPPPRAAVVAAVGVVAHRHAAVASWAGVPAPASSPRWGPCQGAVMMLAASPRRRLYFAVGSPPLLLLLCLRAPTFMGLGVSKLMNMLEEKVTM